MYEVEQTDISASQYAYHDRGFVHEFQANAIANMITDVHMSLTCLVL